MLIYMNFVRDFEKIIYDNLLDLGFANLDDLHPAKRFALIFDNGNRKVPLKRYSIKMSEELSAKMDKLSSGPALQEVIARLREGKDIQPYQSRDTERVHKLDGLLLHWGINHLHLSSIKETEGDGFVKRADELLLFRVDEDNAYLVDVLQHPKGPVAWANSELVRIADRNWPHLHILLRGVALERPISDADYATLRKANIMTCIETERGIVMPTMGVSTSGHSSESLQVFDRTNHRLENLQTLVRQRYESIFPEAKGYATSLSLLAIEEDGFILRDACTSKTMLVPNRYVLG